MWKVLGRGLVRERRVLKGGGMVLLHGRRGVMQLIRGLVV